MSLDEFVEKFFGNIMSKEGLDNVKSAIKKDMLLNEIKYDTAKVEFQVFTDKDNFCPRVEITNEGYNDGEIFFVDCYIE